MPADSVRPHAMRLGWALLVPLLFAGCHAMNTPPDQTPRPQPGEPGYVPTDANGIVHIDTRYPIPFDNHKFTAGCYDTYHCRVIYNNLLVVDQEGDEKSISSASLGDKYPDQVFDGSWIIDINNFPSPAQVSWQSKDGQPHQATIDIADIFKDQVVLHNVPQDQLPPIMRAPVFPGIVLEVNDRTINVYMRGRVPTRDEQIPGNKYSFFRDDLMLAYSKTYD